jgi:thiamine-monophosphate kinase
MPGEKEIISRVRRRARAGSGVVLGVGDDAAVVRINDAKDVIACCDLMVEGVHFRSERAGPAMIGHKALAVTLSDVAAMGGVARFAMVSIALPRRVSAAYVDEILQGIFDLAAACDVSIIGGDTSSSPDSLFIDTSVIGECSRGRAVTRAGAQAGDTIFVTGSLGASALGLALLEKGYRLDGVEEGSPRGQAILKHLRPHPQLALGREIGEAGLATAMIDVSDGLSTDLWHILEESSCGAVIQAEKLPIAETDELEIDPLQFALHGGEEYELIFTARPERRDEVMQLSNSLGTRVTVIGEIVTERGLRLEQDGAIEDVPPLGFEHKI